MRPSGGRTSGARTKNRTHGARSGPPVGHRPCRPPDQGAPQNPKFNRHVCTVQMTSSRVRLGQSFKTVGYGCTSCWGDVGAGDVEADIIYISFIVSVQHIGY